MRQEGNMGAAKRTLRVTRAGLSAVAGVRAAGVACGLKKNGRLDLALVVADGPATVAATFTLNRVQAAPIQVSKRHLRGGRFSAIVLNSGNANACTGPQGLRDAAATAVEAARILRRPVGEVFVASTGVIGRLLDMAAVRAGIRNAAGALKPGGGGRAAQAIMTTDTMAKEAAVRFVVGGRRVTVAGMAKGSGMIAPHMATMLAVVATDATVQPRLLQTALREAVAESLTASRWTATPAPMTWCSASPLVRPGRRRSRPGPEPSGRSGRRCDRFAWRWPR
jgi:glutamate N-acetyltransferase/amino-acid N-acetyltransferase